jgi:hypothetical protein
MTPDCLILQPHARLNVSLHMQAWMMHHPRPHHDPAQQQHKPDPGYLSQHLSKSLWPLSGCCRYDASLFVSCLHLSLSCTPQPAVGDTCKSRLDFESHNPCTYVRALPRLTMLDVLLQPARALLN